MNIVNICMYYLFVIFLFSMSAHADINECARLKGNERILCMAMNTLSANECEKITNLDLRISCIHQVRDRQRQVNAFHPTK